MKLFEHYSKNVSYIIGLAITYFVFGKLGLLFENYTGYASPIWLAAGFSLAALLLIGYRLWPGVLLGSFLTNIPSDIFVLSHEELISTIFIAFIIGIGATLHAVISSIFLNKYADLKDGLIDTKKIFLFYFIAGPLGSIISSLWGVNTLWLSNIVSNADYIFSFFTWWVGDTLGVLIVLPLLMVFFGEPKKVWRYRRASIAIPIIFSMLLIVALFYATDKQENERIESGFREYSALIGESFEKNIAKDIELLYSTQSLFNTFNVHLAQFHNYLEPSLNRNSNFQAISWNQVVTPSMRTTFEKQILLEGQKKFKITQNNKNEAQAPLIGEKYVVVTYIEPIEGNEKAIGYDVYSNEARRTALDIAGLTGKLTVTEPINLVQGKAHKTGVLILLPIYKKIDTTQKISDRTSQLKGYVVGVYSINDFLYQSLQQFKVKNLVVSLMDATNEEKNILLAKYAYSDRGILEAVKEREKNDLKFVLHFEKNINIGQRQWTLNIDATQSYLGEHRSWLTIGVFVSSLLFTILLGLFLMILTGRTFLDKNRAKQLSDEVEQRKLLEHNLNEAKKNLERRVEERTKEIEHERKLVSTIVDTANSIICVIQPDGTMSSMNRYAEDFIGYTEAEVASEPFFWRRFLDPDMQDKVEGIISKANQGEIVKSFQNSWTSKNGQTRMFEWSNTLIQHDDGSMNYLFTIGIDITEHKEVEIALVAAKEAAEASTKAKSEFLANMSHEIRTPMNAIIGMTGLALDTDLNSKQKNYLSKVKISAENLLGIINDILDFSKIEAGKLDFYNVDFKLTDVIKNTLHLISNKSKEKNIKVRVKIDTDVPNVFNADSLRLQQVLVNLVSNAVKFSHQDGTILISAFLKEESDKYAVVQFDVEDAGIGISKENQEKLFQSFTQADSSTTKRFGGTGLGLAVSKKITNLMDGEIWVESEEGKGSIFSFTARMKKVDKEIADKKNIELHNSENHIQKKLQHKNILLVEDNEMNQELIKEILLSNDIYVSIAHNGEEAISEVQKHAFDLILMDIQMPLMDGYEATRKIREMKKYKELPIIALTANVMLDDKQKAINSGMNDHISKPINPKIMFETIAKWIRE